jgi:hypothetical protein
MKYHKTPRSFRTCILSREHASGAFDERLIGAWEVRETCPKVGGSRMGAAEYVRHVAK